VGSSKDRQGFLPGVGLKIREAYESEIESSICHYLEVVLTRHNAFFWKTVSAGFFDPKLKRFRKQKSSFAIAGVSDLILIVNGRFVGFEIKAKKGIQSDAQKAFESRVKKAGGDYFILRSIDDCRAALVTLDIAVSRA
jgi:penicillin-binding protein-related factor A (putative recombinase)